MKVRFSVVRRLFMTAVIGVMTGSGCSNDEAQSAGAESFLNSSDASLRTVPFITLRNRTGSTEPANYFGGERSVMRSGECDVSYAPVKALQQIAEKASFYVPEDIVKLDAIREFPLDDVWAGIEAGRGGKRPILYSHGFYMGFERSCKRASLFKKTLGLAGRFLLFSWPSDGAALNYTRDESDLYWSANPLRETLTDMIDRFGMGNIDIVAHSLGTRGVMLALFTMAIAQRGEQPLVNQVVLIAPDIDAQIFEQYLPLIRPLARNITIYVSSNDSALSLSRQVHGYPRLGQAGKHLEGLAGVEIIDLSELPLSTATGHVYHLYHDLVTDDLSQLLNDEKPASQRSNLRQESKTSWRLISPAD